MNTTGRVVAAWLSCACLAGCGGAMQQSRMSERNADDAKPLTAPLAVGGSLQPKVDIDLQGTASPTIELISARPDVATAADGKIVGRSPGVTAIFQCRPMRFQQRIVATRRPAATMTAHQRSASHGPSRTAAGSAAPPLGRSPASSGSAIHSATTGTKNHQSRRSNDCSGTTPESVRVRRRMRQDIAATRPQ